MKFLGSFILLLGIIACGGDAPETCKYGAPVPIFSKDIKGVSTHNFKQNGQKAVEELRFADGTSLELFQSGCNEIRQEFRFTISGDYSTQPDSFWFTQAIDQMINLSKLDEKYFSLAMSAGAIQQNQEQMTIGQPVDLEQDTYIMVDRLVEPNSALVIVVFEKRS